MSAAPDYTVLIEGMDDLNFADASEKISRAAQTAINNTARFARSDSAEAMRKTYNFPGNYLDPSSGRLIVSQRAKLSNLEAVITGRQRPTSLARFVIQHNGVVIEMKRGQITKLNRAFPIKLRRGSGQGAGSNLGLAVRVTGHAAPRNAYKPKMLSANKNSSLWLLYGISVDQAFRYTKEMAADRAALYLETEVSRLMGVDDL
jgi:hypothetical protein